MSEKLDNFRKKKEYLICVDSDGCAMDTMNSKHIQCFGPCMIEEWNLRKWNDAILARWNDINLYTITRGINRFQGLLKALQEIDSVYVSIDGMEDLKEWVEHTPELSNEALEKAINQSGSLMLKKALRWSQSVNEKIQMLKEKEKRPFSGVKEALLYAHRFADIAIVSSANLQAVIQEWEMHELLEHTDIVLAQDTGSKAYCIQKLLKKGYEKEKVLMTGDAMGDYEAAKLNGVFFYPILVRHEPESWQEFKEKAVSKLIEGNYGETYQKEKTDAFMDNLK